MTKIFSLWNNIHRVSNSSYVSSATVHTNSSIFYTFIFISFDIKIWTVPVHLLSMRDTYRIVLVSIYRTVLVFYYTKQFSCYYIKQLLFQLREPLSFESTNSFRFVSLFVVSVFLTFFYYWKTLFLCSLHFRKEVHFSIQPKLSENIAEIHSFLSNSLSFKVFLYNLSKGLSVDLSHIVFFSDVFSYDYLMYYFIT